MASLSLWIASVAIERDLFLFLGGDSRSGSIPDRFCGWIIPDCYTLGGCSDLSGETRWGGEGGGKAGEGKGKGKGSSPYQHLRRVTRFLFQAHPDVAAIRDPRFIASDQLWATPI